MGKYVSFITNIATFFTVVLGGFLGGIILYSTFILWCESFVKHHFVSNGIFFWVLMVPVMIVSFVFIFRFTFYWAMYVGFYIGNFGLKNKKMTEEEIDKLRNFLKVHTYDIISFKPFCWRPKTEKEIEIDKQREQKRKRNMM